MPHDDKVLIWKTGKLEITYTGELKKVDKPTATNLHDVMNKVTTIEPLQIDVLT